MAIATTLVARPALRRLRKLAGLSMTDLARKIRVTPSAVSAWELGARSPSESLIQPLAAALNTTPAQLLDIIDERQKPAA